MIKSILYREKKILVLLLGCIVFYLLVNELLSYRLSNYLKSQELEVVFYNYDKISISLKDGSATIVNLVTVLNDSVDEIRQTRKKEVLNTYKINNFFIGSYKRGRNLEIVHYQDNSFLIFMRSNKIFTQLINHKKYNYLRCNNSIQFVEISGDNIVDVTSENFRIRSKNINFIVVKGNYLFLYNLSYDKWNRVRMTIVYKQQLPVQIENIAVSRNIIFITDILNRILKINNLSSNFSKYEFSPNFPIRGIMDSNDNIYLVPDGRYFQVIKIDTNDQKEIIVDTRKVENFSDLLLQEIHLENDSLLWVLGKSSNLIRHNIKNGCKAYWNIPKTSRGAYSIADREGNKLLFRVNSRIISFNKKTDKFENFCDIQGIDKFSYKIDSKKGSVWFTSSHSLYSYNQKTKELINRYISMIGSLIYDFYFDKSNGLLLGISCGLVLMDEERNLVKYFTIEDDLPDNRVVSIEEINTGFWLGTFNGLTKMNKETSNFFNYYKKDGLTHNEFNRGSSFYQSDSLLLFGSMNSFVKFDPRKIAQVDSHQPKFINLSCYHTKEKKVKDVQYNLDAIKEVNLPSDRNFISFVFAGQTDDILYSINDSEWILADLGKVNLPSLNGGKHILKVRSKINPSLPLTYKIYVNKVFYKKIWVQFAFVNLLLVVLFVIYLISKRRRAKEKNRLLKVRELEDAALRNQMNAHFLFNGINNIQSILLLKGEKFVNKYIYSLTNLLRFNLESSGNKKILLKDEIEYLKSYVQLEHLRRDERFRYEFLIAEDLNLKEIWIPPMLFQPIVENAIKHGLLPKKSNGFLSIEFKKVGNYLMGKVSDNGVGMAATKELHKNKMHRSYGNKILKKRMDIYNQIHEGYIEYSVTSESKEMGTSVGLKILLLK